MRIKTGGEEKGTEATYSTEYNGSLFGSFPLEELEERAKTAILISGRFTVTQAVDLECDFVAVLGFPTASGAIF
jgi:hypothetical protein